MAEIITYRPCDNNIPISNVAFVLMCDQHTFVIISEILRKGLVIRCESKVGSAMFS